MKNKQRFIYLLDLLKEKTDENHWLSTSEIIKAMENDGISINRKTLAEYISAIDQCGYNIEVDRRSENLYALIDRRFDEIELRLLIDAVTYYGFIPVKRKHDLIDKILLMTSKYMRETLKPKKIYPTKTDDNNIYYKISELMYAFLKNRKVKFKLLIYISPKKQDYRHGGKEYTFHPYDFVINDGKYYVLGYSENHDRNINIRIDRISSLMVLDENFEYPVGFSADENCNMDFYMYSGRSEKLKFFVDKQAITSWVDKFGKTTSFSNKGNGYIMEQTVEISPTFFGWIFQFKGKIKIISPQSVVEEFKDYIRSFE